VRLVTDAPMDELARDSWAGHRAAKVLTNAVVNRGQDGPDTADGSTSGVQPLERHHSRMLMVCVGFDRRRCLVGTSMAVIPSVTTTASRAAPDSGGTYGTGSPVRP
jgi:hypothetical protein